MRPARLLLPCLALTGLVLGACGDDGPAPGPTESLTILAASSLRDAFLEIGEAYEAAHPGTKVEFAFAGSGDLANQIIEGAPADVFASADAVSMGRLVEAGESAGEPAVIARNSMAIITQTGNPENITGLADLADPELIVVLCADTVPCGRLASTILRDAGVTVRPASLEDKVKGVVTKVTTGEADAGIVFVTDVLAAQNLATGVEIPADQNQITEYLISITKSSSNPAAAADFAAFVASPTGQAILASYGFLAP